MLNETQLPEVYRLIRCGVGDETYGVDMSRVRTIQRIDLLRQEPSSAEDTAILGSPDLAGWLLSSEGDIPVFSLASLLGMSDAAALRIGAGSSKRIVVLNPLKSGPNRSNKETQKPWGLLVDRVSQVIRLPAERVDPLPQGVVKPSKDAYRGVIRYEQELELFLAPERLHPYGAPVEEISDAPIQHASAPSAPPQMPTLASRGPTMRGSGGGAGTSGPNRLLVFSVAKSQEWERPLTLGLSITQVPEILEAARTIRVPGSPDFVRGLFNWRDRPVPIVDLGERLGMQTPDRPAPNGDTRLVIARHRSLRPHPQSGETSPRRSISEDPGVLVGFHVVPGIRILNLPTDHRPCTQELPVNQTLTRGAVELESETLVIPDIGAVLGHDR